MTNTMTKTRTFTMTKTRTFTRTELEEFLKAGGICRTNHFIPEYCRYDSSFSYPYRYIGLAYYTLPNDYLGGYAMDGVWRFADGDTLWVILKEPVTDVQNLGYTYPARIRFNVNY